MEHYSNKFENHLHAYYLEIIAVHINALLTFDVFFNMIEIIINNFLLFTLI